MIKSKSLRKCIRRKLEKTLSQIPEVHLNRLKVIWAQRPIKNRFAEHSRNEDLLDNAMKSQLGKHNIACVAVSPVVVRHGWQAKRYPNFVSPQYKGIHS